MTREQAEFATLVLRSCNWDVRVDDKLVDPNDPRTVGKYKLAGRMLNGFGVIYTDGLNSMRRYCIDGRITKLCRAMN